VKQGGGSAKRRKVTEDALKRGSKGSLQAADHSKGHRHARHLAKIVINDTKNVKVSSEGAKYQGAENEEGSERIAAKRAALQELSRRHNKILDMRYNGIGAEWILRKRRMFHRLWRA
jgi:hypothetical protein